MQFLLGLIILSIIVFSFIRLKIGVAIYLAYLFLIPYMNINFLGLNLSYNFVNTLVLMAFIVEFKYKNKRKIDWVLFKPFFIFYLLLMLAIPFQEGLSISIAFNNFRLDVMSFLMLPFVLYNIIKNDVGAIKLYRNIAVVCVIIIAVYGLFLTTTNGLNPYIIIMASLNNAEFNEEYVTIGGGRMFGRLSSVFTHPMTFALNLGFSLIYIYSLKDKISKWWLIPILIMVSINVFTCGIRSVIGGLGIVILYYLIASKNIKVLFGTCIVGSIGYFIISRIPEMASYVSSIADVNATKTDIGGSSIEMRIEQLYGCFDEISDCTLLGKGYGWTSYYMSIYKNHPVMLAFESLIYVVLCNWGLWGVLVWSIFLYQWYRRTHQRCNAKEIIMPVSLMLFYIAYSCITGEYGYMKYFLLFYVLMMGEFQYKNMNIYETKSTNNRILSSPISSI